MCRLRRKGFRRSEMPAQMLILQNEFCHEEIYSVFCWLSPVCRSMLSLRWNRPLSADRTEHDFGDVKLGETRITFTLTSSADVVILSASTNCECTNGVGPQAVAGNKGDKSTAEVSYEAREKGFSARISRYGIRPEALPRRFLG